MSILYEGTQTNWNGLVGSMEIRAVDPVAIDDLQVYPDLERKRAKVRARLSSTLGKPVTARLDLSVKERNGRHRRGERPCRGAARAARPRWSAS